MTSLISTPVAALPEFVYSVLIEQQSAEAWSAQVLGWLDIKVEATTREAALARLRQVLEARLGQAEIVQVKLSNPNYQNPWLKLAGKYKDDLLFEEMMAAIEVDRQAAEADLPEAKRA